jgi:hypothetical protein
MNCIKSIYILRDYGTVRLTMLSVFAMLSFFSVFYSTLMIIIPEIQLTVFHIIPFSGVLILIYPLHKFLHCLPIWSNGRKMSFSIKMTANRYPILYCDVRDAVSRNLMITVVTSPAVIITLAVLIGALTNPQYIHYFSFIGAINFGLCVTDFIYLSFLLKVPQHSYVENFRDGFHILIRSI